MLLLSVKQYYPQTDSATGHGDRMCFSSTCAMAIKYLRPEALKGSNADDDYLKTVLKYGDTTQYTAHIKASTVYGVTTRFSQKANRQFLLSELQAGYPVATGVLHKGSSKKPIGGGHWMLLIGASATQGIFHDPYGEMDNVYGGYPKRGVGGANVKYTWANWMPRWAVEGDGSGWVMTFRPTTPLPIANTWDGILEAAKIAGAKFPQVVAAQWACESGWGQYCSGTNNVFGIKGSGTKKETKEWNGVKFITIVDEFKDYPSIQECVTDLVTKWYKDYKEYKGVNRASTADECAHLLVKEKYCTDPAYATKLIRLLRQK